MPWVAIGTNDGTTVCNTHFGMSREYRLFDVEDGQVKREWTVPNPYADPERHRHAETDDIMGVLDGAHVCIGRKMGRKSPPIIHRYHRVPLLTRLERVDECLQAFLEARSDAFQSFSVEDDEWGPITADALRRLAAGDVPGQPQNPATK